MAYFLVLLADTQDAGCPDGHPYRADPPDHEPPDHEPYVDELVAAHRLLLGGPFERPVLDGIRAAYVVRADDECEAAAIAADDPLVRSGAAHAVVVRWDLVGVDLDALAPELASGQVRRRDLDAGDQRQESRF